MKIKKFILYLAPPYAWAFLTVAVSLNFMTYFGLRAIYTPSPEMYHDLGTRLDDALPFMPIFILPYVLAFVQWVAGYIILVRENKYICYRFMTAEIMCKIICLICFAVFPVTIDRPEMTGTGFIPWLTRLIFAADAPTNLFPSIHCLESYFVTRGAFSLKKVFPGYKAIMCIFTVFVFLSTVLLKQHFIADCVAAVVLAEIMLFVSARLPFVRNTLSGSARKPSGSSARGTGKAVN